MENDDSGLSGPSILGWVRVPLLTNVWEITSNSQPLGGWLSHPVLKKIRVNVNWDDEMFPILIWENKIDGNQTTNQMGCN